MSDVTDTTYAIADTAETGFGAQLEVGNGASPETFQAVAGVVSITPGDMATEDQDVTHLRSPNNHREHRPGIRNSGAFSCSLRWLPTDESQSNAGGGSGSFTSGGLISIWSNRTIKNFRIKLASGTLWPFRAYISKFQPGAINLTDPIDATVEFMPTKAYDADLP